MSEPERGQLILGASARAGSPNVSARLAALAALAPLAAERIIDIGAGEGSFAQPLAALCRHLTLVDRQAAALVRARARLGGHTNISYLAARAEAIGCADATFDAVFMIEVLDHVDDPAAALREAVRVLRPGGHLFLTVPNRAFPFETHPVRLFGRHLPPIYAPFLPWWRWLHRRCATARVFTPSSLRHLADQAGLIDLRYDFLMPPFERHPLLRRPSQWLARTPLRRFGVSIVACLRKPSEY